MSNTLDTRFGKLEFESGYPTNETAQQHYDKLDIQRAVQVYLWALPMASYSAMTNAFRHLVCDDHTLIIADNSGEQRYLMLTANQDTIIGFAGERIDAIFIER